MKKIIYLTCVCALIMTSCKKTRQCECKNANGVYDSGEVVATKSKANKVCKDLSNTTTDCYLK